MAVRNLKERIRKFSKVITAVIGIGMLYGGWVFVQNNILHRPVREYIMSINGEKVYKTDFNRELFRMHQQAENMLVQKKQLLSQIGLDTSEIKGLPEEMLKEYLIKSFVDRKVLYTSAKNLKIKVSKGDINKQVEEIQNQIGGKDHFIQYITANGYNLTTFKDQLRSEMTIKKVQEKIQESSKVSEEELKKAYDRFKYFNFEDQTYEEVKDQIEEILNNENSSAILNSYVAKELENAKIEFNDEEYKKLYEDTQKVIFEKEEYKYKKHNLNERIISIFFSNQQGYSKELEDNIIKAIEKDLDHLVAIKNKAEEVGIKASEDLLGLDQLGDYSKKYYNYIVDTYVPSEVEMKNRFETNRRSYDTQNSIEGYVVGQDFEPSSKDLLKLKSEAEELMKEITKENFSDYARKYSVDTASAVNGGKLGENTDVNEFVPEFAKAIKEAKAGEIVGPVQTEFGYHIIYVESKDEKNENIATASHILLVPTISEETKVELFNKLAQLKEQLDSKQVTWEQVNNQGKYNYPIKEQFKRLTKFDAIPGIGNDSELLNKLFELNVGDTIEHRAEFGVFLLTKVSEIPFKKATFEDVKERIRLEFALAHAEKVLGEID